MCHGWSQKGVEKGYTITEIYEVWHFDEVGQYDSQTQRRALFTEYINTFMKMKQDGPNGVRPREKQ